MAYPLTRAISNRRLENFLIPTGPISLLWILPLSSSSTRGSPRALHVIYDHLDSREVSLVDITDKPNGEWTTNMARRLTDYEDGFLRDKRFVIIDRDTLYCTQFRNALAGAGVKPIRLPPKSPNLNAHMERFMGTVKREVCLEIIPQSEKQLRKMLTEHVEHYNRERNHQGLQNHAIPLPDERLNYTGPAIERSARLGGLLNYYHRNAA